VKNALICLVLMILLAPASHAGGVENQYEFSKILFPGTKTWQPVDSLPQADMKMIVRDRELLKSIYLKTRQNLLIEYPAICSFITRALYEYEHWDGGLWKSVDMDGDGITDIAYFGSVQCDEGYAGVVWLDGPDGPLERDVTIIPYKVLRVDTTESRRFCGVKPRCCTGEVDEYFLGDLLNPSGIADIRVHIGLDLPAGMKIAHDPYVVRRKAIMRLVPVERDEYPPDSTSSRPGAAQGNIIASCSPDATGTILAYFKDYKGRRWGLLVVDKDSRKLRSDVTYDVDVGWIRLD
jgi:hypothetical protein